MSDRDRELRQLFLDGRITVEEFNALASANTSESTPDGSVPRLEKHPPEREVAFRYRNRSRLLIAGTSVVVIGAAVAGFVALGSDEQSGVAGTPGTTAEDVVLIPPTAPQTSDEAFVSIQSVEIPIEIVDLSVYNPFPDQLELRIGFDRESQRHRLIPGENLLSVDPANLEPDSSGELQLVFFDKGVLVGGGRFFVRSGVQPSLGLAFDDFGFTSDGVWTESFSIDRPNAVLDEECSLRSEVIMALPTKGLTDALADITSSSSLGAFRDAYSKVADTLYRFVSTHRYRLNSLKYLDSLRSAFTHYDDALDAASSASIASSTELLNSSIRAYSEAMDSAREELFVDDICYR